MRHLTAALAALLVLAALCLPAGCGGGSADGDIDGDTGAAVPWEAQAALSGTALKLDLAGGFFDRPFPLDPALDPDGTVGVAGFPDGGIRTLRPHLEFVDQVRGFSTMGAVFLPFDGPLDRASLPADGRASLEPAAAVFLVNVDHGSPGYGSRVPVTVATESDPEPLRVPHLLSVLPVLGLALESLTTYAVVATDALRAEGGARLGSPADLETLKWAWGRTVDWTGAPAALVRLADGTSALAAWLTDSSPPAGTLPPPAIETIRAVSVFTTGDPTAGMRAISAVIRDEYAGTVPDAWQVTEANDDFCLIEGTFPAPRWQTGDPPYTDKEAKAGRIAWQDGRPVKVTTDPLRFSLTIPRRPMPAAGFPLLAFAHGMGGDYLQAIRRDEGSGVTVAMVAARRGIAAGGLDAVAHGSRTPLDGESTGGLNFFNFLNPWSVRDNVRQTVGDYILFSRVAANLAVDPALCPGSDASASPDGRIHWDGANAFFMGHSLGSSIGGLVPGSDPGVRVAILSGAGGNAMSFILSQTTPLDIRGTMELLFGFDAALGHELDPHDPLLTLFQMVFDEADGPNFARLATSRRDPAWPVRHILQLHGLADSYTPELTASSVAAAFGLDLAENTATSDDYRARFEMMRDRVSYAGGQVVSMPVSANRTLPSGERLTAVVRWYEVPGAPEINPHYGTWRMSSVRFQYGCFLRTFLDDGVPTLPAPSETWDAPCR